MKCTRTKIPDVLIFEPEVFNDERGFFFENFRQDIFNQILGRNVVFVQENHTHSKKNVLRGLHYQLPPKSQGKLVRVIQGEIFDVSVDIRKESETCGQWVGEVISSENKKQLWIPPGFAHGFLVLSDMAECLYKTTEYYDQSLERSICWDDPALGIKWPLVFSPFLSSKDRDINHMTVFSFD